MDQGNVLQKEQASAQAAGAAPASGAPGTPAGPVDILMVNDNPGILFALRMTLADLDANLVTAASGEEALMLLLRQEFALILLDVKMGGLDGFETARLIRQRPRSRRTPIIFLSGHRVTDHDRDTGFALGAVDYLFMPVAPELLKAKIQVYLDARLPRPGSAAAQAVPGGRLGDGEAGDNGAGTLARLSSAERLILEHAADYVALLDGHARWLYAGTSYRQQYGELVGPGLGYLAIVHPEDRPQVAACLSRRDATGCRQRLRYRVLGSPERYLESDMTAVLDAGGARQLVLVSRDVSERKEIEAYVLHEAFHDSLTGLPNRLLLRDRLSQATAHRERLHATVALLFIDLDRFKEINDTLGHAAGDRVLQDVAERLSRCVRDGDTVARMGGDEFVIMLVGLQDVQYAGGVASKIVDAVAAPCHIDGNALHVTPSIGIAIFPDDAQDVDELLRSADTAMYHAKRDGGARFCFFASQMQEAARRRLSLGLALQRAIGEGEFLMYYQAKVDAVTGAICGFEALMRWPQAEGEPISPAIFIPLAEETGRIEPIGAWAIKQAIAQLLRLAEEGFGNVPVAVNVSAQQFRRGALPASLAGAIASAGIAPGLLEMELTESGAMSNPATAIEMLEQIHALGMSIAIDDFGTGYSSLSYLKRLPIDTLKIDASFVRDIDSDASDAAIVLAIITLAHILGLTVIAEGVETAAQVAFLRTHGCDQMQGHFFSEALPPAEALALLRRGPFPLPSLH